MKFLWCNGEVSFEFYLLSRGMSRVDPFRTWSSFRKSFYSSGARRMDRGERNGQYDQRKNDDHGGELHSVHGFGLVPRRSEEIPEASVRRSSNERNHEGEQASHVWRKNVSSLFLIAGCRLRYVYHRSA